MLRCVETRRSIELSDPRALRAYAHPTRLALIGLLRREGPMTATRAAGEVGESVASCSFHLRQLAKYGLVEEAGGGRGREKPWRATAMFTVLPDDSADPEVAAASELASTVIIERWFGSAAAWFGSRSAEPPEWRRAAQFADQVLHLTADELAELGRRVEALTREYRDRAEQPEGARPVTFIRLAFPVDGS
jgi:predicted ArsR family transcriptional regulator